MIDSNTMCRHTRPWYRRRYRHAGGVEDWAVACCCGVLDDDGERMIVCDGCGFWVHTRCNGVRDSDEEPMAGFACKTCREVAAAVKSEAAAAATAGEVAAPAAGAAAGEAAVKPEEGPAVAGAAAGEGDAVGSKRAREGSAE